MISDERRDRFWEVICSFYGFMWLGLALTVSMLVLSLFSYAYVDESTGSSIIARVNLVVLAFLLVGFLYPIRRCHDR
jgi:NADH:ubiquinone oxidoreductase subunit 3 (subunit A)